MMTAMLLVAVLASEPEAAEEAHHANAEAAEHHGSAHGAKHELDAPSFIIHHVSDDEDYEFELPVPGVTEHPTLHLGKIFEALRWETVPGACEAPVTGALSAVPSMGRWMAGCRDLRPTKATFMMWIAAALLLLVTFLGVNRDKTKLVPKGVMPNVIEILVLFVRDEIAYANIGKKEGDRYVPYLCSLFFFVLFMNWLGLIPNFGSATGQLSVTLVLAVLTFIIVQIASIRSAGIGGYLGHLTGGTPPALWIIMIPVEFLGLFTKPFALMVRLFANMLGGHMVLFFIIGLIFMLHPAMALMAVPLGAVIYVLEIFVGILQAYIFTLLTALFIGQGVEMGHHGHSDEHAHQEHAH
ncbi:MAG: F0F1 ATP synthase subunit A [Archangiaceae bacterium]|nr:F0F1 ATP synthase subunit A [Archangiaceae bacterium]